jgi:uncharacterized protein involved in exopolysaccharide biosynthesis
LEIARANLATLKLRYKPDHPDIRAAERIISELQAQAEKEASRASDESPSNAVSLEEQARQKRLRDLQAELDVIDHQLSVGEAEENRLREVIANYGRKVEAAPTRESELVELTRDYEVLKKSYDTLLAKKEDSKLAADLERRQIGEQFRVLDAASLPARPSNQMPRLALSFSGAIAGLVLGLLLTAFLEYRNSSFSREGEVTRLLELPVLALVPIMPSDREQRGRRLRTLLFDVAGTGVVVVSMAVLVVWGLRQL